MKFGLGLVSIIATATLLSCTRNPHSACGETSCFGNQMQDQNTSGDAKSDKSILDPKAPLTQLPTTTQQSPPPVIQKSGEQAKTGSTPDQLIADCTKTAEDNDFTDDQVTKVCAKANEYSENCLTQALEFGMHRDDVADVCAHAKKGTVDCIAKALNDGAYSEEVPADCNQ